MSRTTYPIDFRSTLHFKKKLPPLKKLADICETPPESLVIVYDLRLRAIPFFKSFIKSATATYEVKGGEKLKDLEDFPRHARNIAKLIDKHRITQPHLVAIGGGSLGDFCGFFASIYRRGISYSTVPTTWLAAIDSAHGGKTALNLRKIKNQFGSFYPAKNILMSRDFFESLPSSELKSALGEAVKMVFIQGSPLTEYFEEASRIDIQSLWKILPQLIEAKREIVFLDPFEQKGLRRQLNLGHSLGHVLELEYGLKHGEAVAFGMEFAIQWSHHRGYLSEAELKKCERLLFEVAGFKRLKDFFAKEGMLRRSKLSQLIRQDKKLLADQRIDFVFLKNIGNPMVSAVDLESFIFEASRQGITR